MLHEITRSSCEDAMSYLVRKSIRVGRALSKNESCFTFIV